MPYVIKPMEIQFKEDTAHQIHSQLILHNRIEAIKMGVQDDKQSVNDLVVIALKNNPDDFEEIIGVES